MKQLHSAAGGNTMNPHNHHGGLVQSHEMHLLYLARAFNRTN